MQSLTQNVVGSYTEAQLTERLTADGAVLGVRFDITDIFGNVLGNVGTIQAMTASVSFDTSRSVIGSLGLTMLPNEVINSPFQFYILPWFRLQMLDGGVAEWPMGLYVWNIPTRRNVGMPDEEWDVTLGDLGHILTLAGPGLLGFVAPKGANIMDLVEHIVTAELGFTDTSGIVKSATKMTADLHWGVTSISAQKAAHQYQHEMKVYETRMHQYEIAHAKWEAHRKKVERERKAGKGKTTYTYTYTTKMVGKGTHRHEVTTRHRHAHHHKLEHVGHAPHKPKKPRKPPRFKGAVGTSWFDILDALHAHAGYHPPWFDLTGRYRATPIPDLQSAPAAKTYEDSGSGVVIIPVRSSENLSYIANRVFARGSSANGFYDVATSDLNDLSPGHPLSQQVIGFYIDVMVSDPHASTIDQLQVTADTELNKRLKHCAGQIDMDTLAWPVHEAFDIIGVVYSTDAELGGAGVTTLEASWDLDLRTGHMSHVLDRITA